MANFNLPVTKENVLFTLNVLERRIRIYFSSDPRPSSAPYISGDTFRKLADHVYEEGNKTCLPTTVVNGDIVFVHTDLLTEFFTYIHPKIMCRYILVCHNSDASFGKQFVPFLDNKVLAVFCENATVLHTKVHPIPIGLENLSYHNHGEISFFSLLQSKNVKKKKNRILYGFSVSTNPEERTRALSVCGRLSFADRISGRLNTLQYLKLLQGYKFVLSPPGNGIDCIRTWEAMYLGVVPIVKRSVAMEYFASLGLPLWIVDDWRELTNVTEKKLALMYKYLYHHANTSALYSNYWKEQITYAKYK